METVEKYYVVGKEFLNKQEALNYESKLFNNLTLRARNLKLYYWAMLGYPGENNAIYLINNFCHNHKFIFGKYKDKCIGEIIMTDLQYINWCIKNISSFKLTKEEDALFSTSWERYIGGYSWDITHNETMIISGERYNIELIDWEEKIIDNKN